MKKVLSLFIGLLLFSASLTVLYLGMRAVMGVGGSCAEGGPYQIAVHCPKGTGWQLPVSVWTMVIGGLMYLYAAANIKSSPQWWYLFWTALFVSLGWNFLEFALHAPADDSGGAIGMWICAVVFIIMGVAPLFALPSGKWRFKDNEAPTLIEVFLGKATVDAQGNKSQDARMMLLALHIVTVAAGIYLGALVTTL